MSLSPLWVEFVPPAGEIFEFSSKSGKCRVLCIFVAKNYLKADNTVTGRGLNPPLGTEDVKLTGC